MVGTSQRLTAVPDNSLDSTFLNWNVSGIMNLCREYMIHDMI